MASSIFSRSILFTAQWCLAVALTLLLSGSALAQGPRIAARPDRGTMPNGSYAVSDFENISLQNGNVNLSIPLASLPPIAGGKLSWSIKAHYNSKLWNITKTQVEAQGTAQFHSYVVDTPAVSELGGWRISDRYKISIRPASADFEYLTEVPFNSLHDEAPDDMSYTNYQLLINYNWYKVVLSMPDGSEHELRPVDYSPYAGSQDFLKGYYKESPYQLGTMRYYSFDGSFLYATVTTEGNWTVYMPDGTRVIETPDGIQRIQDTNGNKIKIYSDSNGTHYQDEQTGREIRYSYNPTGNDGQPMGTVSYQTVGGTWMYVYIKFGTTYVHGQVYNVKDWPPGDPGPQPCERQQELNQSIDVVREIVLPQSELNVTRKFEFKYNSDPEFDETATSFARFLCTESSQSYTRERSKGLGALSEMKTPSGATIKYAYSLDSFPFHIETDKIAEESITEKKVSYNNNSTTDKWEYTVTNYGGTVKNPDQSTVTESKYTRKFGFSFSIGKAGLSYRTTKPFTKIERHWVDMPFNGVYLDSPGGPVNFNPVVDVEYTTLLDADGNALKMSAKAFQYDYNGNILQTTEYDWFDPALITSRDAQGVPTGVPGSATVLRVTNNSYYNPATTSTSGNIYANRPLSNPASKLIVNAIKESTVGASQTRFSYDGEAYGTAPSVGNLTNLSKWDNVTNSWISTSMTYDTYGNVATTTDPRGKVTQVFYEDNTHALPTRVVVDPQNNTGQQESRSEYDYSTGAVTSQTDVNNNVTNIYYTNPLLDGAIDPYGRPGAVYSPAVLVNGTNQQRRTTTIYEDHLRRVTVASDLNAEGDGLLKSRSTQDELGRTILTEQSEDGLNYTISSQTIYELAAKVTFQSNPRRSAVASTDGWTRSTTDALGRVTEVATFSGTTKPLNNVPCDTTNNCTGKVTSTYNANQTTVTDQAEKVRRSIVNALGQLIRVDEPDVNNNLGNVDTPTQPTSYTYDVLGNLTQVTQGAQTRTFTYSSLSRLTSATNPESGAISYQYDANGNLTLKTDARGITTTFSYDALNRVTLRNYSGSTPDVTYTYDTLANNKGRLASVSNIVSTYNYTGYDALGRLTDSSQLTDGQTYSMSYGYNLAGGLTSQTYPSGRVITTAYDNSGRLSQVSGQKTGESNKTYASSPAYSAHGALSAIKLGNNLWEHTSFNSRLQPTEIGLGTEQSGVDRLKLNYAYGTTNNNGNVQSQTLTIPGGPTLTQSYTYDELNRLKSAVEMNGATQSWKQTYLYDRWGNRRFNQVSTETTLPFIDANNQNAVNPAISEANNQLTGTGYRYDVAGNLECDPAHPCHPTTSVAYFQYDAENKLEKSGGGAAADGTDYKYDGDGRRVKKVTGTAQVTTVFVYNAMGQMVAEYTNTSPEPDGGGTSYLTADNLGTPRAITGADGSVKARHDYLPFGEEIAYNVGGRSDSQKYVFGTGALDNDRQKFTQKERDNETGLDYFGARYYASLQGRFINADAFFKDSDLQDPQSWNKYVYVRNNPLFFIDPSGEKAEVTITVDEEKKTGTVKVKASFAVYAAKGQKVTEEQLKDQEYLIKSQIESTYSGVYTKNGITYTVSAEVDVQVVSSEQEAIDGGNKGKFDNIVEVGNKTVYSEDEGRALAAVSHVEGEKFDRMYVDARTSPTINVFPHEFSHLLGGSQHLGDGNVLGTRKPIPSRITNTDFQQLFGTQIRLAEIRGKKPTVEVRRAAISGRSIKWID
jgi:RHS repeat-associated protein